MTGDVNAVMSGSAEVLWDLKKKKQELRFKLRTRELIFGPRWGETSLGLRDARANE